MAISLREDTIFAPATALGRAAVAIIRVSGPQARKSGDIFGFRLPPHREARIRSLRDGDRKIDRALVLFFRGEGSYTGEDMVELHVHGGRAICDAVMTVLARASGFRFAAPGEFSMRAVLNGRMDLTAAEAVNDLVDAETDAQLDQALRQLDGRLAERFDGWATALTRTRAHLEAYIDFPDEEIPVTVLDGIEVELATILRSMRAFLDDGRRGERLREGFRIAVVGPPNTGKSSFVNWLAERDAAIVADQAGTTRDLIEVHLDLGGFPVIVADTAGLRGSCDEIEMIGVSRALDWAAKADLRVVIRNAAAPDETLSALDLEAFDIVLYNKTDLAPAGWQARENGLAMSVKYEHGLDQVLTTLSRVVRERIGVDTRPMITRARHRALLEDGITGLQSALAGLRVCEGLEMVAENLRSSGVALGSVTGAVTTEDLLDVVFRDFCIGK